MPFQPIDFTAPTFQQANPMLSGIQAGQDLATRALQQQAQAVRNKYLGQQLASQLGLTQAQQKIAEAGVPFAGKEDQEKLNAAILANKLSQMKVKDPLLFQTGQAGQIGSEIYLKENPSINQMGMATQQAQPQALPQQQAMQSPVSAVLPTGGQVSVAPQNALQNLFAQTPAEDTSVATPTHTPTQQQVNAPETFADKLTSAIGLDNKLKQARADYYEKRAQVTDWVNLGQDHRNELMAQAAGFGILPQTAEREFESGVTLPEMAEKSGFGKNPINWPDSIYPTTKTALTQIQERGQAQAELNVMTPEITNAVLPYERRFAGYSPSQIIDAIGNKNPEQQGKYIGAKILMPEMTGIRMRLARGKLGVEAIKEITDESMDRIKTLYPTLSPQAYKIANDFVDGVLNQAVNAAAKYGLSPIRQGVKGMPGEQNQTTAQASPEIDNLVSFYQNKPQYKGWSKDRIRATLRKAGVPGA